MILRAVCGQVQPRCVHRRRNRLEARPNDFDENNKAETGEPPSLIFSLPRPPIALLLLSLLDLASDALVRQELSFCRSVLKKRTCCQMEKELAFLKIQLDTAQQRFDVGMKEYLESKTECDDLKKKKAHLRVFGEIIFMVARVRKRSSNTSHSIRAHPTMCMRDLTTAMLVCVWEQGLRKKR